MPTYNKYHENGVEMIVEQYHAKSLVRTSVPSLFSWAEAYLNPYQGCYHDCKYCDGKSEGYYMHEDFADRIRVKGNAPHLLEQYLQKKGFIPFGRTKTSTLLDYIPSIKESVQSTQPPKFIIHIGGGVCDVYQPAEAQVNITQNLLHIMDDYKFPVFILTKNRLALRDVDLLKKINKDTYACCSYTITLADETSQKIFEPNASTTQERFDAIKTLRKEGIHAGVHFYPVLPFIGDTDENMHNIYSQAKKAGAEFVYCWGLTLKPGRNKQEFLQTLKEHVPSLHAQYKRLYSNNNRYGNPDATQFRKMGLVWPEVKAFKLGYEYGIPYAARRYIPEGRIRTNLHLSEMLIKVAYIKKHILNSQVEVHPLYQAAKFLEHYHKDITGLSVEAIRTLPLAEHIYPYIQEFKNKRNYILELEKEAYKAVSNTHR